MGLEFCHVSIQDSVKLEYGQYDLPDKTVQVDTGGVLEIKVFMTDVINGLVVYQEGTISVLKGEMSGEDGIVGFYHSCGITGEGEVQGDGKFQLGLLGLIHRDVFHQQEGRNPGCGKPGSLQACKLINQPVDLVQDPVNKLLANGVVSTGMVIESIFACDELLWVQELTVGANEPH